MLEVQRSFKRTVGVLPARRGDVVALAGVEVALSGQDMHVRTAAVAVEHGRPGIAIGLQPGPGDPLELVEGLVDLFVGGLVLGRPGDHGRAVAVLEVERVGDFGDRLRIAAQDLDLLALLAGVVVVGKQVLRGCGRGACAVRQELDEHGYSAAPGRSPRSWIRSARTSRSRATR